MKQKIIMLFKPYIIILCRILNGIYTKMHIGEITYDSMR